MYSNPGVRALGALGGGVAVALSLPPFGWWPLAIAGVAALAWAIDGQSCRTRLLIGAAFGLGQFTIGLWWMGEFNGAGAGAVVVLETLFVMGATVVAPRPVVLPAALVLAEAARGAVPFGGLPMGGIALGQIAGPLGGSARVGGHLLLVALTAVAGVGVAAVVSRHRRSAVAAGALVAITVVTGVVSPDGGRADAILNVAAVQGGGPRGFRKDDVDERLVFEAQLAASAALPAGLDLVVWPEDVVDVEGDIVDAPEAGEVAALARRTGATVVAGVIEGQGRRFRNAAVAWSPEGRIVARYDKVHRVPFGEYIPARALFKRLGDVSAVPRDAIAGTGTGLLGTPAGDLGALISYEVFFADRARAATNAGARLLLVPTNAASFSTSQVPTQELAAARLRAVESGRDLVQAAPTGYSGVIDHRGRVLDRTTLGNREVLAATVSLRTGRTVYSRAGDAPVIVAAGLVALVAVLRPRLRRGSRKAR